MFNRKSSLDDDTGGGETRHRIVALNTARSMILGLKRHELRNSCSRSSLNNSGPRGLTMAMFPFTSKNPFARKEKRSGEKCLVSLLLNAPSEGLVDEGLLGEERVFWNGQLFQEMTIPEISVQKVRARFGYRGKLK